MNGFGQVTSPVSSMCLPPSCDPFTGNEGFALASIALTLIPLLFFPGAAKLLAVAGPLYFPQSV